MPDAETSDAWVVHGLMLELGQEPPPAELERGELGDGSIREIALLQARLGLPSGAVDARALLDECRRGRADRHATAEVRGTISDENGARVAGAIVRVLARGLRSDQVIGQTRSDHEGAYSVRYRARPALAIVVRAIDRASKPTRTVDSPVTINPAPLVKLDLAFGVGVYPGRAEWDQLADGVRSLLDGVAPYSLSRADVAVLARRAGLAPTRLQLYAWANKRGHENDLAPVVLYALARAGLPTALPVLGARSTEALTAAFNQSLARNAVPPSASASLAATIAVLQALAVAAPPAQSVPAVRILGPIVSGLGLDAAAQSRLIGLMTDTADTTDARWAKIAVDPTFAPHIDAIQLGLRLSAIARNVQPLVAALAQRVPTLDRFPELAALTLDDWRGLVAKSGAPDGMPGATPAAQQEAFAQQLRRTIEVLLPMETLRARLSDTTTFANSDAPAFLSRHPDFSFVTQHAGDYVGRTEPDAAPAVTIDLMRMQRLFRLSPRASELSYLWSQGFRSAIDVTLVGRAQFLAAHAQGLGDAARANDMFSRAAQLAAATALLYGQLAPVTHALPLRVLPALKPNGG